MKHLAIIESALDLAGKEGAFTGRQSQYFFNVFDDHAKQVEDLSQKSLEQQNQIKNLQAELEKQNPSPKKK
ncbi:hypothetical protein QO206_03395 [Leeuwenhoekiella aequorea]|uniref:hypothetical protein n=1 Tax=Leeuwenhoekiella aequorea TaxID=283736 RepID=UPI00352EC8CE|tara:strand:+ start:31407 stop:31619 length:213 start_codon:yes stop_codon:yes gene_type:complete